MKHLHRQTGLTLVELMVTLVLSLMLVGGIATTFISSREGVKLQQAIARANDGGRAALELIGFDIQMAGYPASDPIESILSARTTEGGSSPDEVGVQYESTIDCRGQATPAYASGTQYVKSVYRIRGGALECVSLDEANAEIGIPTTLLNGVEDLQVLYGENTDNSDGANIPDVYVRADRVTDWNNVLAAQVALQLRSGLDTVTNPVDIQVDLLNQGSSTITGDGRYRIVLSSTFLIRNRLE